MSPEEQKLDQFNKALRANPAYVQFLQSMGVNPNVPIKLSESQRKMAAEWVRKNVGDIGKLEIDPAGNVNQNEGFMKQVAKWGPLVGGAALTAFGIPGVLPGLLGGGGAAAAGSASTALGGSAAGGATTGVIAGTGIPTTLASSGGGGFLSTLASHAPDILKGAGAVLGAGSQSAADNRGANVEAAALTEQLNQNRQRNFFDEVISREQEGRAGATDAFKKAQQTEYVLNNTKDYAPSNGLPSYGFGPHAATDTEKSAASHLRNEVMQRLANGNPVPQPTDPGQFQFDPKLLKPGFFEKLSGYAAPALTGVSGLFK